MNKMVRNRLLMQLLRTAVVWMRLDVIFFCYFGFRMGQIFNIQCSEVPLDLVCLAV